MTHFDQRQPQVETPYNGGRDLFVIQITSTARHQGDLTLAEAAIRLLEKSATADRLRLIIDPFEKLYFSYRFFKTLTGKAPMLSNAWTKR